jgi:1-acyl-sn-glycerol-3-phosphate acyltransferase
VQPIEKLPHPVQLRGNPLARRVLALLGWKVRFEGLPALQGVLAVYPHTSNWDFIVAMLAKWSLGLPVRFWAKDTLFRIPGFGHWLRWVGGVPVQRRAPQGVVAQVAASLALARAQQRLYWLGLSPEGTRQWAPGWRSGFYQVALHAGVPLGVVSLDYGRKLVNATTFIELTGDVETDFASIAALLAGVQGKNPALAAPIQPMPVPQGAGKRTE